jgi:ubiquinone/menaquinone biosynthesis C-methylase UbiE
LEGSQVSGFDISSQAVEVANRKAELSKVQVDFRVMDSENLDYPDATFDGVIGFEALHHVIIYPQTASELRRVMKPGAKAVFAENWGGENWLFELWRRSTSMKRAKSSDRGEVILSSPLLDRYLGPYFSEIRVESFSLTYMMKKYWTSRTFCLALYSLDKLLLKLPLDSFCGESVVTLVR